MGFRSGEVRSTCERAPSIVSIELIEFRVSLSDSGGRKSVMRIVHIVVKHIIKEFAHETRLPIIFCLILSGLVSDYSASFRSGRALSILRCHLQTRPHPGHSTAQRQICFLEHILALSVHMPFHTPSSCIAVLWVL